MMGVKLKPVCSSEPRQRQMMSLTVADFWTLCEIEKMEQKARPSNTKASLIQHEEILSG
jgi:hypothetical protein